jgi:hypothetical protein
MREHSTTGGELTDIDPEKVDIRPLGLSDFFVPEGAIIQSTKNTVTAPGELQLD